MLQLCLTLCYSIDCSLPDSSVHGIFPSKNTGMGCHAPLQGSSLPRNRTHITYISCITSRFFTTACAVLFLVTQLCLTLCDPMDCNPPGAPVHRDSAGKNTGVGWCALLQVTTASIYVNVISLIYYSVFLSHIKFKNKAVNMVLYNKEFLDKIYTLLYYFNKN